MAGETDNNHQGFDNQTDEDKKSARPLADFLAGVAAVAAEAVSADEDLPVGRRVKQIREQKGLSLTDLAQRTGMDEQTLSDIEKESASPPLGVLVKLGKALEMKLGTLIASGTDRPYAVVRVSERQKMSRFASQRGTRYGYTYQALAPQKKDRSMEPFLVTLEPVEEEVPPSTHDGEEFIFVLEGKLEVIIGDAREILEPGDTIYYDSNQPHLVRSYGRNSARIVAVLYSQ
ncbi:MAG: helix-turn-helix transcriptional regulator [Deltaproteobacteria bacterium]|nr:helix-turn-helix transcriptional regulator [Deltaproteobacteria bacterium]MBW2052886.1 helix-turn-helix transcriptional regulator [Deltaproteobacteria bacterium]MBW2141410.1 helix-turn-helix transcriptional regulator [Deltaproteobacteria bacterium]MBW2324012.1 helix-turn-helix transcriptional regulator [Deltaproteobacteria bacterium]